MKSYLVRSALRTSMFLLLAMMPAGRALADVTFSGELRLRPEIKTNNDFNDNTHDSVSFVGSRLRVTGAGLATEDIAVKFTVQDTRNWGEEPGAGAVNGLTDVGEAVDIHEAFVDFQHFMNSPVALRAGRQELVYGDQRLLGNFGWSNQGRAFDAFRAMYVGNFVSVDVFTAKRRELNATVAGTTTRDRDLSGVYGTLKPIYPGALVDLYYLYDREGDTTGGGDDRKVQTIGARLAAKHGPLDYTVEAPFQFGDNGTITASSVPVKISAHALAVKTGWTFPGNAEIRIGAEYDYASGDDNASDNKSKTFNNLYPTNHPFYGFMDNQGWRNMSTWSGTVSFKPERRWFVLTQYWMYELAEEKDGWYNAAGTATGAVRAASAANTEKNVGQEVDLLVRFVQNRNVIWETGISQFIPGDYIDKKVANEGQQTWAYVSTTVKF